MEKFGVITPEFTPCEGCGVIINKKDSSFPLCKDCKKRSRPLRQTIAELGIKTASEFEGIN